MNCQPYIGGFDLQPCDDLADEIRPVEGCHDVVCIRDIGKLARKLQRIAREVSDVLHLAARVVVREDAQWRDIPPARADDPACPRV